MATVIKDFNDTSIPQNFSTGLYSEKSYNLAQQYACKVLDSIVGGVTEVLKSIKSQQHPVAFVFKNLNDFILGAYVEFIPNEDDPTKPGNWTYTWTFYEDDIPADSRIVTAYDSDLCNIFWAYTSNKHNFGFKGAEFQGDCFIYMLSLIHKWLDENAVEGDGEVVGVEIKGLVQFTVQVENGEKVFACVVDGEVKQQIKDDAAIEV